jgi:hypothetical protein
MNRNVCTHNAGENCGTLTFTVNLVGSSALPVSVQFATQNASATASVDYVTSSGTLNFAPCESSKTIAITILQESVVENPESFNVVLSGAMPTNTVTLNPAVGVGTIENGHAFVAVPSLNWSGLVLLRMCWWSC